MAESATEIAEAKQAVEQALGKEPALALDMVHVALYMALDTGTAQQLEDDQLAVSLLAQVLARPEVLICFSRFCCPSQLFKLANTN